MAREHRAKPSPYAVGSICSLGVGAMVARIVAVHGIAQQFKGSELLVAGWGAALRDGMRIAGVREADLPSNEDIEAVFYGDLFRPKGTKQVGMAPLRASDVAEGFEQDLLESWWRTAAAEGASVGADTASKVRAPNWVQRALNQLSNVSFFAGLSERAFIGALKQVRAYFTDPAIRKAIQDRMARVVDDQTVLVIGHSLGSVVAYEALCAHPEWPVQHLVTLGSPLGLSRVIFDRLNPTPLNGRGAWPGSARTWVNVADRGDVVALVKELATRFGDGVADVLVHNGAKAHDVGPYLTAAETGAAVANALRVNRSKGVG